jgi:hypothetical protein
MTVARHLLTPVGLLAAGLAIALPLAGCETGSSSANSSVSAGFRPDERGALGTLTYRAVDKLVAEVPDLALGRSVVVGSILDVQRVDKSLPFGSLVADLARSRLVQKGVLVSEMRLRTAVLLDKKQGAVTLSNDRASVVPPPSAAAILTGTFAASDETIFVSLKLVAVSDARIVGAVDFVVPRRGSEVLLSPAT